MGDPFGTGKKPSSRTEAQNKRLHAICGDIARQKEWAGQRWDRETWKRILIAAVYGQKVVPGLDGGVVVLNASSSRMTVGQLSEVIAFAEAWAVQQGIQLSDDPGYEECEADSEQL